MFNKHFYINPKIEEYKQELSDRLSKEMKELITTKNNILSPDDINKLVNIINFRFYIGDFILSHPKFEHILCKMLDDNQKDYDIKTFEQVLKLYDRGFPSGCGSYYMNIELNYFIEKIKNNSLEPSMTDEIKNILLDILSNCTWDAEFFCFSDKQ